MQAGSFTPETPRFDAEELIKRINILSANFRSNGDKVIFVQHDGTRENCFIPGTDEWKILPELVVEDQDKLVGKTANDSFYETDLDSFLKANEINQIVITGSATDFCVESTIQSALTRDFEITVISDGHTAADRPHITAKNVIDHYNWIWENLSPTKGNISLINTDEFIATHFQSS